MITQKREDETWDIWSDDVNMNSSAQAVEPMNLQSAINYFDYVEGQCDAAIQAQDDLIRGITRRIPRIAVPSGTGAELVALSLASLPAATLASSDLPFPEFRQVASLANKVVEKQMPMATNRFMSQASREEIDEIEKLEADIECLRQLMRNIERQILDYTPITASEAVLKLKFMAALMLDGSEIEGDFFAYLVEESADILEEQLAAEGIG